MKIFFGLLFLTSFATVAYWMDGNYYAAFSWFYATTGLCYVLTN